LYNCEGLKKFSDPPLPEGPRVDRPLENLINNYLIGMRICSFHMPGVPFIKDFFNMTVEETPVTCLIPLPVLADILLNKGGKSSLPERFRALFTLRGANSDEAVSIIGEAFNDSSALLKHELAYVLGQMGRDSAIPILTAVLQDLQQESIVRHEAAEGLGAIGNPESLKVLRQYLNDPSPAVSETCEIAIDRIERGETAVIGEGEICFGSVDPAPALAGKLSVSELQGILMNSELDLYNRYKAMFALRNRGTPEAVLALCTGFADDSALFRHEIGYVLGQLQHPVSIPALSAQLCLTDEAPMVRHECAEALGSIATEECLTILKEFENDPADVVRESCLVARDMYDYENSEDLHFYPVAD
jgi:deoxyhypusine monooxygenase